MVAALHLVLHGGSHALLMCGCHGCLLAFTDFVYSYLSTLLCSYLLYRPCFSLACVSHTYYLMYWFPHTHSLCGAFMMVLHHCSQPLHVVPSTLLRWCLHCSCGGSHILLRCGLLLMVSSPLVASLVADDDPTHLA